MSGKDVLAGLDVNQVAEFYRRIAKDVDSRKGDLTVSLAAMLLNHWLDNRDPKAIFRFDAPKHLQSHPLVIEGQEYNRAVFLTQKKGRLTGNMEKWLGAIPRLQDKRWDGKSTLSMTYESLVEIPIRYQVTGNDADRDLLYSLRGFQLKSHITLRSSTVHGKSDLKVEVISFESQVLDLYDFNFGEYIKVPNPDFKNKYEVESPVSPESKSVRVFHTNAMRLQQAALATPYKLESKKWIAPASLMTPAFLDPAKKL